MVTAVGFNAPASLAAIRAGIRNVNETNLWDAESGEYLAAGRVLLPHWWIGLGKLAELVAPAIHECLEAAKPIPAEQIPILLGVAAPDRPYRWENLDETILEEIELRLGFKLHSESRVISRGRISGVVGLQIASALLDRYGLQYCIVAGVDSFVRQDVVEYYLEKRRILTPNNSNGFSPGEAGSAVLVGPSGDEKSDELKILGAGISQEKATIESEKPLQGDGLTEAFNKALSQAGIVFSAFDYWLIDQNGEHYKFKEAMLSRIRLERLRKEPRPRPYEIWHPIEYIGEVGAAIVPCLLGLSLHACNKDYAPGPCALMSISGDSGERAALVLKQIVQSG